MSGGEGGGFLSLVPRTDKMSLTGTFWSMRLLQKLGCVLLSNPLSNPNENQEGQRARLVRKNTLIVQEEQ